MAHKKTHTVAYRRKREGKTNYKKRLSLLKSRKPRLVVRASLKNILAQIVTYDEVGDKVMLSAHSRELTKQGFKATRGNLCTAYLVGLLIAKKAKSQNIELAILDLGLNAPIPGSRIFAVVRGACEGGLNVPCNEEVFPSEQRVNGEHIASFAKMLKDDKAKFERQFGAYLKAGVNPEDLPKLILEMKNKIMSV